MTVCSDVFIANVASLDLIRVSSLEKKWDSRVEETGDGTLYFYPGRRLHDDLPGPCPEIELEL